MCVYIQQCVCLDRTCKFIFIYRSIHIYMHFSLSTFIKIHEFILISPVQPNALQFILFYPYLFPYVNSLHSDNEQPGSCYQYYCYLIAQSHSENKVVLKLLTHASNQKRPTNLRSCLFRVLVFNLKAYSPNTVFRVVWIRSFCLLFSIVTLLI